MVDGNGSEKTVITGGDVRRVLKFDPDTQVEINIIGQQGDGSKSPDKERNKFEGGNIEAYLALKDPAKDTSEIPGFVPPPEGEYFVKSLGRNIRPGDDLCPEDPNTLIPVEVRVASVENGLTKFNDPYTGTNFEPGDIVCKLGQFDSFMVIDTLREFIQDRDNPKERAPVDFAIDENGQIVD